jgi:hypothetical protein
MSKSTIWKPKDLSQTEGKTVATVSASQRNQKRAIVREQRREEVKGKQSPLLLSLGLSAFPADYCLTESQKRKAKSQEQEVQQ